jgi:hypothetical protein
VEPLDQRLLALDAAERQMSVSGGRGQPSASIHKTHRKDDNGVTGLTPTVRFMTDTSDTVEEFFDRYAAALVRRDEKVIATMYAVPALIVFPGHLIAVSDVSQTEEFFASTWSQYDGVDAADPQILIMGEAPGTVWADVTWFYGGRAQERFCYQLVAGAQGYRIAVLTPMV